jgi:hypothetical protein
VYVADGHLDWAQSHAYCPTPMLQDPERIRVYVSFLDEAQMGRIGYVDVSARDPRKILDVSAAPVLDVGSAGAFDAHGVTPLSLVDHQGTLYLYYTGWQRGIDIRYWLFVGLALSDDGGQTFKRYSRVPVLDRSDTELLVRTASHVMHCGDHWKMWYIAGDRWIDVEGKQVPSYAMRYLESPDGLHWGAGGQACMQPQAPDEYGFGRPFVMQNAGNYQMWYSIRSKSQGYRLGYAESVDGIQWERQDARIGLTVSAEGWDSEMLCFGAIQETAYGTYLFYNGNQYGQTGFGVATLSS